MKVEIRASARFYFSVTKKLVDQMLWLAKHHYDGECQRTGAQAGQKLWPGSSSVHSRNGILAVWKMRFEPVALDADTVEVSASWDDLDLLSKVAENVPPVRNTGVDLSAADDFRSQMARMLVEATPKIANEWKHEFNV